ncbi:MAG: type II toxin-antitoxin system HicB family antitoxin [Solirubrobacterales bacterium]|nr:type II toxin-antitoxin system HicB family antitoxin [Solirubrobacterales bacterium]MCB0860375.1 type II toxin-antitoxin system HicB family antitoxin [Solirubrobacterales bacterium]HRV59277.1 type II toxin-antitoxin system HicB family antitoxin [Solirubrobacterales bacterium]
MSNWNMMTLTAQIHRENGAYWADIPDLPGVFATGDTLDELFDSLEEGVSSVLESESGSGTVNVNGALISIS